eukprot:Blabericola_migrator_1__5179@NODE_266_length_10604_cov_114_195881_g222_i0_p5_GENE_NODE_266_length_10604_cov_114_195881_g222_i0NODE_266_length_10604_cov_114_195881_g222_i0_p5_ORF_typecomplete_len377_score95_92_NODE_266_length_10604_cov_114_195881_g222_i020383168
MKKDMCGEPEEGDIFLGYNDASQAILHKQKLNIPPPSNVKTTVITSHKSNTVLAQLAGLQLAAKEDGMDWSTYESTLKTILDSAVGETMVDPATSQVVSTYTGVSTTMREFEALYPKLYKGITPHPDKVTQPHMCRHTALHTLHVIPVLRGMVDQANTHTPPAVEAETQTSTVTTQQSLTIITSTQPTGERTTVVMEGDTVPVSPTSTLAEQMAAKDTSLSHPHPSTQPAEPVVEVESVDESDLSCSSVSSDEEPCVSEASSSPHSVTRGISVDTTHMKHPATQNTPPLRDTPFPVPKVTTQDTPTHPPTQRPALNRGISIGMETPRQQKVSPGITRGVPPVYPETARSTHLTHPSTQAINRGIQIGAEAILLKPR